MDKVTFKMFNLDGTTKVSGSIKPTAIMYPPVQLGVTIVPKNNNNKALYLLAITAINVTLGYTLLSCVGVFDGHLLIDAMNIVGEYVSGV